MHLTILGSGIIGTMTAYFALQQNYKVTLIEKNSAPGLGASYQNGGQLSFSHIFSVCDINIFKYAAKNLISNNTPISIDYSELVKNLTWCLNFLKHSHKSARNYDDLFNLAHQSQIAFKAISGKLNNIKQNGTIQIFRSDASFNRVQNLIELYQKYQINCQTIADLALKELLPEYIGNNNKAIYFKDDMSANTYEVILNLIADMKTNSNFTYVTNQEIKDVIFTGNKISQIITNDYKVISDKYIVTPGSYVESLNKKASLSLPVKPLKGYSFNHKNLSLKTCVIDHDSKIVYTPLDGKTRISGLYDFAGFNTKLDNRRLNFMLKNMNDLIKGNNKLSDFSDIWCGFRPLTSDKFPLIGKSRKFENLYYNIGHANLGFTLSSGSSEALIKSLAGDESIIPESFRANRFNI